MSQSATTLVRDGKRLQFALAAPALHLSNNTYDVSSSVFYNISYGASLQSGNYCIGAPGRPAAFFLDDGKKWPLSSGAIITDNRSSITNVTTSQFDSYPLGSTLFAVE